VSNVPIDDYRFTNSLHPSTEEISNGQRFRVAQFFCSNFPARLRSFYVADSTAVRHWGINRFCDMLQQHEMTRSQSSILAKKIQIPNSKFLDPTDIETT